MREMKWWDWYQRTSDQGARMHVCSHTYCGCGDCRTDPELRLKTLLHRGGER